MMNISRFFAKLTTSNPKMCALATVLVFIASGWAASQVQKESGVEVLLSENDPLVKVKQDYAKVFGNPNVIMISATNRRNDDDGKIQSLKDLYTFISSAKSIPGVERIDSIYSIKVPRGSGGMLEVIPFLSKPPVNSNDIKDLRRKIETYEEYQGQLVSSESNAFAAVVFLELNASEEAITAAISQKIQALSKTDWHVGGLPIINSEVVRLIHGDQIILVPAFLGLLLFILFFAYRSFRPVWITMAVIIFNITILKAFMFFTGHELNVVTDVLPLLTAAITSAYCVHFFSQYFMEANSVDSRSHNEVIIRAAEHIGPTITLAGVTTILGFLASAFSELPAIRDFAWFAGVAVAVIILVVNWLCPLLLAFFKSPPSARPRLSNAFVDAKLSGLARYCTSHNKRIIAASGIVAGLAACAIPLLKAEYSALDYFSKGNQVVADARHISKNYGGFSSYNIAVESEDGNITNARTLQVLDDFSQRIKQEFPEDITVNSDIAQPVKRMSWAMNDEEQEYFRAPISDDEAFQLIEMYDWSSSFTTDYSMLVNPARTKTLLTGRFRIIDDGSSFYERPVQTHAKLIADQVLWLNKRLPAGTSARAYGDIPMWSKVVDAVIQGQFISLILALLTIFAVTTWFLRSWLAGLICMAPVSFAVLMNFLAMVVLDIDLDVATSLIAGMALGIGIDDTIHFALTLRRNTSNQSNMQDAVSATMQTSGKAIFLTSVALIAGFLTYFASNFLPIIHFGILNALTLITTTFAALVLLPALFLIAGEQRLGWKKGDINEEAAA